MNLSMENLTKKKEMFFIAGLFAIACLTYIWTINLPITCDGLIHMNDHTDFTLKSWIKSLYTFNGIGKDPEHSVSLLFHRPIFDEILVEIIKKITRYNVNGIHIISILVHSCSVVVSYFIGKEVFRSNTKSIILAFLMNFSIVSILPELEFGLSFSLWLTLFSLCSFYYTVRLFDTDSWVPFFLALAFSFLTIFTKENAMPLGVALSFYVLTKSFFKNKKISKKIIIYVILQALLLCAYLVTRFHKLGNFFTPAASIDNGGQTSFMEIAKKTFGLFLYAFNLPNTIAIPAHVIPFSKGILLFIPSFFILLFILSLFYKFCINIYLREKTCILNSCIFFLMFFILLIPVFKVNRVVSYYLDICCLYIFLLILSLIDSKTKKSCFLLLTFACSFLFVFFIGITHGIKSQSFYLSIIPKEANYLKQNLSHKKSLVKTGTVFLASNFGCSSEKQFVYNHNGRGSFYKYNVDITKKTDLIDFNNYLSNDATIVDYYIDSQSHDFETFFYDGKSFDTELVELSYDKKLEKDFLVGFSFDGRYYYNYIPVLNRKTWTNETVLYFVVPKNSKFDVTESGYSLRYISTNSLESSNLDSLF